MNRFKKKFQFSIYKVWQWLSLLFILFFLCFFFHGINTVDETTLKEQAESLEKAIRRNVVHCYCVEGTYPPSLSYLQEHYALTYDEDLFYVDYVSIGSNIMPDITIIPLYK